ncbi:hypothetical protein LJ656_34140 [Paraburkholderia sp. MMS20-SJTR3]|uniref:Fis family transcriptional regulator n=1 Tax=Paraburkholderia sejongensis TaxID=2886946 RepID=A0ABS8K6H7_9BURK|nr:hypothetical protein [Paraburkholderia sp. MMS20-SJTR3]MCC8397590.1 hypothetical protein [Paraburkholderia sp. MMS20-SJTR3]
MFLPLSRESVDGMMLHIRMALERIRAGEADQSLVYCMARVAWLTGLIAEAGHGLLDTPFLNRALESVRAILETGRETGSWHISPHLVEDLKIIVNEYDRQLRETRLEVIANAVGRLDLLLQRAGLSELWDFP